ncbi:hypothetical protein [Paenibacillus cremeus]|uniref:hypothetical protein n=1 Tax=Paenibacillus cremeus TaxID=2163881 RepID=UPI001646D2A8|nr:hypothetical protein [Paenibacillus cremeus]
MEAWKEKIGEAALQEGIINDPSWLEKLDEPMPVWVVLQLMLKLKEQLETNYISYD